MRRDLGPGVSAIPHDITVETYTSFGRVITREILVNQQCHWVADHRCRIAFRDEYDLAVRSSVGHHDAVPDEIFGEDDAVRLEVATERGEIDAFERAIRLRCMDEEGVTLLRWPARHIAGAEIPGKDLFAGDLRDRVQPVFWLAVGTDPAGGEGIFVADNRCLRPRRDETDPDGDAGDHSGLDEFTT